MKTKSESHSGLSSPTFGKSRHGCALTLRVTQLFSVLLALMTPAHAELLQVVESAPAGGVSQLRVKLKIDNHATDIAATLARAPNVDAEARLFFETQRSDDIGVNALKRGFNVLTADIERLPSADRPDALRDLANYARRDLQAKKIIAHGRAEVANALLGDAARFDALLLQDAQKTPPEKRPLVIETFGSDAFWRTTPFTPRPTLKNLRSFFIAGTATAYAPSNCAATLSKSSAAPALRALFVALDEWTKGKEPPASRAPRATDLASARTLLWPKVTDFLAPIADERLTPKIDADGNETIGLRLPDHALPVATYIGFNARKDAKGAACIAGAEFPFVSTKTDREKASDPRLSLVERYGSRAYFVATTRVVADKLVKERLLLKEDADAYVAAAKNAPF